MRSIMISIKPEWVYKILNGEKVVEVRKSAPKCKLPCKVYIYCTKEKHLALVVGGGTADLFTCSNSETAFIAGGYLANGKVVAEFTLKKVEKFSVGSWRCDDIEKLSCVNYEQMIDYFYKPEELDGNHGKFGYAWHIEELKMYDYPLYLESFRNKCDVKFCVSCPYGNSKIKIDGDFYERVCRDKENLKPITKAPQSWCYVMEQEEL